MKDCKIYVFTALFICLTAVKLCFPTLPAQAGREINRMISCQADYGRVIQAMGRAFGRGQLVQALNDLRLKSGDGLVSVLGEEQHAKASPSPVPALAQP